MYIDILRVLAHQRPLRLTHVMHKANVNCAMAKEFLDFLIKQKLVEEKLINREAAVGYSITQHGVDVLKYFRELIEMLPIVEYEKRSVGLSLDFPVQLKQGE
jgi:predicted transcriptional regulator